MTVGEPMTVATDLVLAGLGAGFAGALLRPGAPACRGRRLWAWALAAHGFAALLGACYHGFGPSMEAASVVLLWRAVLVVLSVGTGLLVSGLAFVVAGRIGPAVLGAMAIKVVVYAVWVWNRNDFLPALCDQGITLLGLLCLSWGEAARPLRPWLIGGVLLTLGGNGVEAFGLSPSPGFNRNDLYHVIEAGALACFYGAGRRMTN